MIRSVEFTPHKDCPLLSQVVMANKKVAVEISVLKHLTYEIQIKSPRLKLIEHRGTEIVSKLFDVLAADKIGELLPTDWRTRLSGIKAAADSESMRMRMLCDYIAGMTDKYALDLYSRISSANPSILFRPF